MPIVIDKETAIKLGLSTVKPSKFRNEKAKLDGKDFDSKKEAKRYGELLILLKAGEISNLLLQVPFELVPAQFRDGKCLERAVVYKADFVYEKKDGEKVVEDTKGVKTREYIIKRKLMLLKFGIKIKEV